MPATDGLGDRIRSAMQIGCSECVTIEKTPERTLRILQSQVGKKIHPDDTESPADDTERSIVLNDVDDPRAVAVLVRGIASRHDDSSFQELEQALTNEGVKVHRYCYRGDPDPDPSYEPWHTLKHPDLLADQLDQQLGSVISQSEDTMPIWLVGHSLGGWLIAYWLCRNKTWFGSESRSMRSRVEGVVLFAAPVFPRDGFLLRIRLPLKLQNDLPHLKFEPHPAADGGQRKEFATVSVPIPGPYRHWVDRRLIGYPPILVVRSEESPDPFITCKETSIADDYKRLVEHVDEELLELRDEEYEVKHTSHEEICNDAHRAVIDWMRDNTSQAPPEVPTVST